MALMHSLWELSSVKMSSHRLTLFIAKTARSLGLPPFPVPQFPTDPVSPLSSLPASSPVSLPTFPLPPSPSKSLPCFQLQFWHNEVVLADSLASRISLLCGPGVGPFSPSPAQLPRALLVRQERYPSPRSHPDPNDQPQTTIALTCAFS